MTTQALEVVDQPTGLIAEQDGWTPAKIDLVKATVAKGASDDELQMFLALANRYQLDPFAKEIWCIKDEKGNTRIQAGRDGFLTIANRNPAYDGMSADVVYQGDTFERTADGVKHVYDLADRKGQIVGAYALVFRRDRSIPSYFFARFSEYAPKSPQSWSPWTKFPSSMILKVAESNALKRAFSISGVTSEDEGVFEDAEPRPGYGKDQVSLSLPKVPNVEAPPEHTLEVGPDGLLSDE